MEEKNLQIEYNLFNLPQTVKQGTVSKALYSWLSDGTKASVVEDTLSNTGYSYLGSMVYSSDQGSLALESVSFSSGQIINTTGAYSPYYHTTDHLGSIRAITNSTGAIAEQNDYYPFGQRTNLEQSYSLLSANRYKYNGKEEQTIGNLQYLDYGARFYDPTIARWLSIDPMAENKHNISLSPYHYVANNPMLFIDPNGEDWYDINGTITWKDQKRELKIDDQTYQSLGKNVLVGTHNRDKDRNEKINTATFSLYLESNTEGASATIKGNTVSADIEQFGTLAEGLYDAEYTTYKGDGAILIEGGGDVPTVSGNLNNPDNYNADGALKPTSEHVMDEILFHKGNWARESLSTNMFRNGKRVQISEGCQTGGCGPGSLPKYRAFIKNAVGFKGKYYLRANSNKK